MNITATITSARASQLARLEEADAKALANAKANVQAKYGLSKAEADTMVRVDFPNKPSKFQVTYACPTCGKPVTRYTSDLFVVGPNGKALPGVVRPCTECLKAAGKGKVETNKELRAILVVAKRKGIPALINGEINPALVSSEETE